MDQLSFLSYYFFNNNFNNRIVAFSDAFLDEVTPQVFTIDYPKTFVVKVFKKKNKDKKLIP